MSSNDSFFSFFSFINGPFSLYCIQNERKKEESGKKGGKFYNNSTYKNSRRTNYPRDRVIFEKHVARTVENIVQRIQRDLDGFTASNRGNRGKVRSSTKALNKGRM